MKQELELSKKFVQLNTPIDLTAHKILVAAREELGLPDLASTLAKILGDWWRGTGSGKGHQGWPE